MEEPQGANLEALTLSEKSRENFEAYFDWDSSEKKSLNANHQIKVYSYYSGKPKTLVCIAIFVPNMSALTDHADAIQAALREYPQEIIQPSATTIDRSRKAKDDNSPLFGDDQSSETLSNDKESPADHLSTIHGHKNQSTLDSTLHNQKGARRNLDNELGVEQAVEESRQSLAEKDDFPVEIHGPIIVDKKTGKKEQKKLAEFDQSAQDENGAIVFIDYHSTDEIPELLNMVFELSKISKKIKETQIIEIPLRINNQNGVLVLEIQHERRIKKATFIHFNQNISQFRADWRYKNEITRSLQNIDENASCSVESTGPLRLTEPTSSNFQTPTRTGVTAIPKTPDSTQPIDNEDGTLKLIPNGNRSSVLQGDAKNKIYDGPSPFQPEQRQKDEGNPKAVPVENQYFFPECLHSFSLKELSKEKLEEIHKAYKRLKIQRLKNNGRGNAYKDLTGEKTLAIPSIKFLDELERYLTDNKPWSYSLPFVERIARRINTKTYQALTTVSDFYKELSQQYNDKKLNQEKTPKKKELIITDTLRWGAGNVGPDQSKEEFDLRYQAYKNSVKRPAFDDKTAEKRKKLLERTETIIHNRALLHARTR